MANLAAKWVNQQIKNALMKMDEEPEFILHDEDRKFEATHHLAISTAQTQPDAPGKRQPERPES